MYEQFRPVVDQNGKVEFKLFFPDNTKDPSQYVRGGLSQLKTSRPGENSKPYSANGLASWPSLAL